MNSEKIKYKGNWYYVDVEDLYEPSITKIFLFSDPDLTQVVKKGNKTLMVKKEDMEDKLKEWAGAGFSMGSSIFPVNRGGQMNRGGYGGANNLGGPNMMYTYEIKPLTRNLQPKPTEFNVDEKIHAGHFIEGQELNKKDGKKHRGTVLRVEENEDHEPMFYVILCDETSIKMNIDPTTAILLSGENFVDNRNIMKHMTTDKPDLARAGQMQETMKAKTIKETLNEKDMSAAKWNKAQDILIDKYGYDPQQAYFILQDYSMENYSIGDLTPKELADAAEEFAADWGESLDESLNEYSIWDREKDDLDKIYNIKQLPEFKKGWEGMYNKPLFEWLIKTLDKHGKGESIELITSVFRKARYEYDMSEKNRMKWVYNKFKKHNIYDINLIEDLFQRYDELLTHANRL